MIGLSKIAVTVVFVATPVAESAGVLALTVTGAVSAVVKVQVTGVVMAVPVSLLADTAAVYLVDPLSAAPGVSVVVRVTPS